MNDIMIQLDNLRAAVASADASLDKVIDPSFWAWIFPFVLAYVLVRDLIRAVDRVRLAVEALSERVKTLEWDLHVRHQTLTEIAGTIDSIEDNTRR